MQLVLGLALFQAAGWVPGSSTLEIWMGHGAVQSKQPGVHWPPLCCPVLSCAVLRSSGLSCALLVSPGLSWALLRCPVLSCLLLGSLVVSWALLGSSVLSWALLGSPVLSSALSSSPVLSGHTPRAKVREGLAKSIRNVIILRRNPTLWLGFVDSHAQNP